MKNLKKLIVATSLFIGSLAFAQAPEKMSYQAVVRNTTNNLVVSQSVGMQISILQGSATGTAVYVETQTPTSNANGLVSLEIGGGTVVSGNMATINWANGPYFIKTETDPSGGSSYTITGTSQLLSAPYALYAKTSGSSTPGPQGPQGPAGANGIDGATGPMGPQGPQGLTGPAGATGANGTNGLDGATGPIGPQGLTGPAGANGTNGLDGVTGPMGPQGPQGLTGPAGTNGTNGQGVPVGGTTGQVLAKVNGTDYNTQWVTPSGGAVGPVMLVRASANTAQSIPFGNNIASPTLATCFGSVTTNIGGAYNATTGIFTAPSEGLYIVSIQAIASVNGTAIIPYIDVNNDYIDNTQNTNAVIGPDFLGVQSLNSASIQTAINNRGQLTAQVYLTAGQVFSIRFNTTSSAVNSAPRTDGSTNFTVVKLL